MRFPLSVKQKIVLSLWGTTLFLLILVGSVASLWFLQDQGRRLDDFLIREVRGVQDTVQAFLRANGSLRSGGTTSEGETLVFLRSYFADRVNRPLPYKTTLGIFDAENRLILSSNQALPLSVGSADGGSEVQLETIASDRPYRLAILALTEGERRMGTIRMACLTETLAEVWSSFLVTMLLVLGLVFVSFGSLGTFLIRWSLRPVREMSLSAQDISETHLDLRLAVPAGKDELAQMARTLNRLLDRLERDFEFEEQLVGQLTHELRTPLAIIRGRNEVALERLVPAPGGLRAVLEDNLADIDNVAMLLNTLLSLARLDSRIEPVRIQDIRLDHLLRGLIDELGPLWDEKDLSFHLSLPGRVSAWKDCPPVVVSGDPILLRQVFLNLLTNAYKYAPRASRIHLTVEAPDDPPEPVWSTTVRNSGPAIPEDSLELVFKRFYRVEVQDPDRYEREAGLGQKGFGLGLSIAKTMVELHGGTIRAYNPPIGGAAFEIRLPGKPSSPGKNQRRSSP